MYNLEKLCLHYVDSYHYGFNFGNAGISFAYIFLGSIHENEKLYDLGVQILENTVSNLDDLDEIDMLLFSNALLLLERSNIIELPDTFFANFDSFTQQRLSALTYSTGDLRPFLFLYYIAQRSSSATYENSNVDEVYDLLGEIIMEIDSMSSEITWKYDLKKLKFLMYSELLLSIFDQLKYAPAFTHAVEIRLKYFFELNSEKKYDENHNFKTWFFDKLMDNSNTVHKNSTSQNIQLFFLDNTEDGRLLRHSMQTVKGILNSDLGNILASALKKNKIQNDILILVQYYSNYQHDLPFSPTSRVLL